jgi:hypothetical protein
MRAFATEPVHGVQITNPQAFRGEAHEAVRQRIMAAGVEAMARMNRPESSMADSAASAPLAQGPEVDRAAERHGKKLGFF